ncbi:MAG: hypothetical protein JRF54_03365 [Deltaproteobacteria bacterium]|nr:hypothetical protein [Deltaproteobacteria bacterium]
MSSKIRIFGSLLLLAAVGVAGCGADEEEYHGLGLGAAADRDASGEGSGEGGAGQSAAQLDSGPAIYTDDDFSELDIQNRDPFRSFARAFKAQAAAPAQRRVLLPSTSLDEMQLIARPEVVQTGGSEGMPVTLNWRVDRIRPGSVVLTREDPTSPDKPPLTRVMPLHEGGEAPQLTAP